MVFTVCFECVQLLVFCAVCITEAFLHMTGNCLNFSHFSVQLRVTVKELYVWSISSNCHQRKAGP